jgi:hypothetical protein
VRLYELRHRRAERAGRRLDVGSRLDRVPVKQDHLVAGPRQEQSGELAGRAAANHDDPHNCTPFATASNRSATLTANATSFSLR